MLGRAAAEQQYDAQSFAQVVVSRIGPLAGDFAESGRIGQPASLGGSAPSKGRAGEASRGDAEHCGQGLRSASATPDRPPTAWNRSMAYDPRVKTAGD